MSQDGEREARWCGDRVRSRFVPREVLYFLLLSLRGDTRTCSFKTKTMASCAPTVPCPFCESRGTRGFFNKPCGLCEGRAFLFEAPHKCVACSGRGRRRERGHLLESEYSICSGTGFTLRKLQPCEICCKKSSLVQKGLQQELHAHK